jgi:hypothetical protein
MPLRVMTPDTGGTTHQPRTPLRLSIALALLLPVYQSGAQGQMSQTCDPALTASTPSARFTTPDAGAVMDRRTGLTWMRCAVGQRWDGAGCTGVPLASSWSGAFDQALALNKGGGFGGHADWRVPALDELASLVEHRCYDPALNLELFPAAPITGFWSADPHPSPDHAMMIHFKYGGQYMGNKDQAWALRLVRD